MAGEERSLFRLLLLFPFSFLLLLVHSSPSISTWNSFLPHFILLPSYKPLGGISSSCMALICHGLTPDFRGREGSGKWLWIHETQQPYNIQDNSLQHSHALTLLLLFYFVNRFQSPICFYASCYSEPREGRVANEKNFPYFGLFVVLSVHTHLVQVNNQCSCRAQQFASTQPLIIC